MIRNKTLSTWTIALINVCAICNIKNFPLQAEYGLSIIFYLILSSIFFFIPVALVSAELASGWPDRGVYTWVREGLGPKWGFLAIWLQWSVNVIWYPTILSVIAGTIAYMIDPALATNKTFVFCVVLAAYWPMTIVNFFGMRLSGWISSASALFGTMIPIALIILLGIWWVGSSHPSHIAFTWHGLFPNLTSLNQLVLLSGVLFGLAGMEMSAVHARDVEHPRRDYPRAIFLSALLILVFSVLGSLAISAIVPIQQIELASGAMEAFKSLFDTLQMKWATPTIAAIMTFGALGMMSTWIIGPSRGMLATAEHGDLPSTFHKVNRWGMPTHILIAQACIVTILSFVFLYMPSVSSSYWILLALSSMLYMIMYILMFIAAIRLRYRYGHIPRSFQVPGGLIGLWVVSLLGLFGALFGLGISFLPPSQLETGSLASFEAFLIGGIALFCSLPFLIYKCRKPSWKKQGDH